MMSLKDTCVLDQWKSREIAGFCSDPPNLASVTLHNISAHHDFYSMLKSKAATSKVLFRDLIYVAALIEDMIFINFSWKCLGKLAHGIIRK